MRTLERVIALGAILLVTLSSAGCGGSGGSGATPVVPRLYAADGRSGVAGNLYLIDVSDASATTIGPIGHAITGLAFAPDGNLYGVTPAKITPSVLVRIDVATGAGTVVAQLQDAGAAMQGCTDITFVGARLLGWGQPTKPLNQRALEIDWATGLVTDLGGGTVSGGGNAFEADGAGNLILVRTLVQKRTLYDVDPVTGVPTAGPVLMPDGNVINSMAYLDGILYCVDSTNGGVPPNDLATIDLATNTVTKIGPLPVGVDGLAGNVK